MTDSSMVSWVALFTTMPMVFHRKLMSYRPFCRTFGIGLRHHFATQSQAVRSSSKDGQ